MRHIKGRHLDGTGRGSGRGKGIKRDMGKGRCDGGGRGCWVLVNKTDALVKLSDGVPTLLPNNAAHNGCSHILSQ